MNKFAITLSACALFLGAAQQARAITLDANSLSGAGLNLNGTDSGGGLGTFHLVNDASGYAFAIVDGAFDETDSGGVRGTIDSTFTITLPAVLSGNPQSATVVGTGNITFEDGFAGTVTFTEITVDTTKAQGSILRGTLNLFPTTPGSTADLTLLAAVNGQASISFAINKSLSTILGDSFNQTLAFDALLSNQPPSTPDGGATAMLLGIGFLGAAGIRRKMS